VGALQGLSATFSNVGFVGLPLVILAFGADAALPAVIIVIVDTVVMMGIATALIEVDLGGHGAARNIVLGLVRNPIIIASLVGLGLNLGSVEIPGPLMSYGDLLANAAGPCALFALGATLAGRPLREGAGETAFLTVMKLGVHPLLVAITALYVFDLSPLWASVAIVQASLPIAANVYVLAQRYEVHAGQVSTAILISTAVSVFTVSIVLAQLYGGG
ncbi:MAG: AEC family transporter, partial [Ectothiorhodospiraceae bacterium]|jgi:predicted permease